MIWSLSVLLFSGIPVQQTLVDQGKHFKNYHQAHQVARQSHKPLLIIIGDGVQSGESPVSLPTIRRTAERRKLLKNYVVVVIDTTTAHGRTVHKAYRKPKLPHVVVLDNRQEYQIFKTSEKLFGQRWTEILKSHRNGKQETPKPAAIYCYT